MIVWGHRKAHRREGTPKDSLRDTPWGYTGGHTPGTRLGGTQGDTPQGHTSHVGMLYNFNITIYQNGVDRKTRRQQQLHGLLEAERKKDSQIHRGAN